MTQSSLQQSFELFDQPLLCYKAIHTWHFQSIPSLSLPSDLTRRLSLRATLCMISLLERGRLSAPLFSCIQQSDSRPSASSIDKTVPLVSFVARYNDADHFAESEDEEELEDNDTVLEFCQLVAMICQYNRSRDIARWHGLVTCQTRILAAATIRGWCLFHSELPNCAATVRGRRLFEKIRNSRAICHMYDQRGGQFINGDKVCPELCL